MAAEPVKLVDLAGLAQLGKAPVSPDAPAGADASYEPEFEAIQREIDKLAMVTDAGVSTDWNLVASQSVAVLAGKSKDLKVAAYLAEALTRTNGLEGFAAGAHILRDLVETYWETLFPPLKRMRGRINALDWWLDRAKAYLEAYEDTSPLPPEMVSALKDDLKSLDETLGGKSDDAPSLLSMIESVGRLPIQEPQAPPAPEAAPDQPAPPAAPATGQTAAAQPAPTQASAPQAASASVPAGSLEQARGQLAAGLDQLFSASYVLFKTDPGSPTPYRLVRLAAWMPLAAPPPAKSGQTMIPPPPPQVRASLEQALASGNYMAAVENAETRVNEFRFWLDLSRVSAEGLRNLGPGYESALAAVETETALYVRRFPGVENLSFSDGTPFADDKTKLWITRLGRAGASNSGGAPAGAGDDDEESVMDKARELAAKNQAVGAVTLLQGKLGSAASGRMRLRWRIGLAEVLMASGSPENARPIVEQILADLDDHKLDDFDPELALKGLLTARQGLAGAADEPAKARAREVLSRIMRLNPAEGLRLSGVQ